MVCGADSADVASLARVGEGGTRQDERVPGWTTIAIAGDSMVPAASPGDWWLVRRTTRIRPGDLVAFRHPVRIDLLVVKRAVERRPDGWWMLGDNPARSDDSRHFGAVPDDRIVGVLRLRYRRARP